MLFDNTNVPQAISNNVSKKTPTNILEVNNFCNLLPFMASFLLGWCLVKLAKIPWTALKGQKGPRFQRFEEDLEVARKPFVRYKKHDGRYRQCVAVLAGMILCQSAERGEKRKGEKEIFKNTMHLFQTTFLRSIVCFLKIIRWEVIH